MKINTEQVVSNKTKFNVTSVTKRSTLDHFVTLVTDLKNEGVTSFSIEVSHMSRLSHEEKSAPSIEMPKMNYNPAIEWITIAMKEGHVEPSQPSVGRIIGWPQRRLAVNSLLIEFAFWCRKQRTDIDVFDQEALITLLDKILIRIGDEYEFPPLEVCRQKFDGLRNL